MARISELHYSNTYAANSGVAEFLEVSLAPGENPADFTVAFYDADGTSLLNVTLDNPFVQTSFDADANEFIYVIQNGPFAITLTDPDGQQAFNSEAFALVNTNTNQVLDFYDIGGGTTEIEALDGPALGATSENIAVPTGPDAATYSLQFNQPNPDTLVLQAVTPGDTGVICFTSGTLIRTPSGARKIEDLRPGDLVSTLDNGPQSLRWVGHRKVAAKGKFAPIRIEQGTLGNTRDLLVSPQHRMLIQGARAELLFGQAEVLAAALHLVDDRQITRQEGGRVTYHHFLFDTHQIIFAEDAPSESFHPGDWSLGILGDAVREEVLTLFPKLIAQGYGPSARQALKSHEAALLRG